MNARTESEANAAMEPATDDRWLRGSRRIEVEDHNFRALVLRIGLYAGVVILVGGTVLVTRACA